MIRFHPLTNHVLLELEPEPEQSEIIAVQKSVEDLTRFGEVLATGPECRLVKVGQRVLASITAGTELSHGVLVNEKAVLAVMHE